MIRQHPAPDSGGASRPKNSRKTPSQRSELMDVRDFHRAFPTRPRLLALETPASYLQALLGANHLPSNIQSALTRQARTVYPGTATEDITELIARVKGSLNPKAFLQARTMMPKHDDGRQCRRCFVGIEHRYMCRLCSAGRSVEQYPHLKGNICRRHHLWVGPGTTPATQMKAGPDAVRADVTFRRLRNRNALDALRYMEVRAVFQRWTALNRGENRIFEEQEPQLYPLMMAATAAVLQPANLKGILDPRTTYASAYNLLHATLSRCIADNVEVLADGFWLLLRPAFLSVREWVESGHAGKSGDRHALPVPDFPDAVANQIIRPLEPFSRFLDQLKTCNADRWRDLNQRLYDYGPLPVTHENVPMESSLSANYICARGHHHQKPPNTMALAMKQNRSGCPYCTNFLPLAGYNTLAETNPVLATEWHPTLNAPVTPSDVIAGSNSRKYWWLCPEGHTYQKTPHTLSRPDRWNCPYCSGRLPIPGVTTLAVRNPRLAAEWAAGLNGDLTPAMVSEGSGIKVWWLCPNGHSYPAEIASRKQTGCPYCANLKVWRGYNDLKTTHPELASEWHSTLNGDLKPTDIVAGAARKIWWLCPNKQHPYQSSVVGRAFGGRGCPYCANQRIWPGDNDLATLAPRLASQWDYKKNANLKPTSVGAGTARKVWWLCPRGHSFQAAVNKRVAGLGCPVCFRIDRPRHL